MQESQKEPYCLMDERRAGRASRAFRFFEPREYERKISTWSDEVFETVYLKRFLLKPSPVDLLPSLMASFIESYTTGNGTSEIGKIVHGLWYHWKRPNGRRVLADGAFLGEENEDEKQLANLWPISGHLSPTYTRRLEEFSKACRRPWSKDLDPLVWKERLRQRLQAGPTVGAKGIQGLTDQQLLDYISYLALVTLRYPGFVSTSIDSYISGRLNRDFSKRWGPRVEGNVPPPCKEYITDVYHWASACLVTPLVASLKPAEDRAEEAELLLEGCLDSLRYSGMVVVKLLLAAASKVHVSPQLYLEKLQELQLSSPKMVEFLNDIISRSGYSHYWAKIIDRNKFTYFENEINRGLNTLNALIITNFDLNDSLWKMYALNSRCILIRSVEAAATLSKALGISLPQPSANPIRRWRK